MPESWLLIHYFLSKRIFAIARQELKTPLNQIENFFFCNQKEWKRMEKRLIFSPCGSLVFKNPTPKITSWLLLVHISNLGNHWYRKNTLLQAADPDSGINSVDLIWDYKQELWFPWASSFSMKLGFGCRIKQSGLGYAVITNRHPISLVILAFWGCICSCCSNSKFRFPFLL